MLQGRPLHLELVEGEKGGTCAGLGNGALGQNPIGLNHQIGEFCPDFRV
jgi:hypothetical protein